MIRINLLPHREQKRKARQQRFIGAAVVSLVVGLAVVGAGYLFLEANKAYQASRNEFLDAKNKELDTEIEEIKKLKAERDALLTRKTVIEKLQDNRSEAVRLLDWVVRNLPEGVYLKEVKQTGMTVSLTGFTHSNAKVSALMKAIEQSKMLQAPRLVEIKLPEASKVARLSEFTVSATIFREAPAEDKKAAAPAAAGTAAAAPTPAKVETK